MTSLPFLYQDFRGGLNTKEAPYLLTDNQSRDLLNVQSTVAGAIIKRNGLVTFAQAGSALLNSLFAFEETGPYLIGAGGGTLYYIDGSGSSNSLQTGLDANARWEFVQAPPQSAQGPLWGMNGVDPPQQWAGAPGTSASPWTATTGTGLLSTVPNGKYMALWSNKIWVSGVTSNPSRLFWCDSQIGNPTIATSWPAINVIDFEPNDGEPITGIGQCGPYLLVGKRHKLYVVVDPDTGAYRQISDTIGIASHRSIAQGPDGCHFLAEDRGVYVTNGTKLTPLSDTIQPNLDAIQPGQRQYAAATFYSGHYYLSICDDGTTNNKTLDYDTTLNSWWVHSIASNQFAIWHPTAAAQLFSAKSLVQGGGGDGTLFGGTGSFGVDGNFGGTVATTGGGTTGGTTTATTFGSGTFGSGTFGGSGTTTGGTTLTGGSGTLTGGVVDECLVPNVYTDNGQPMTWIWRGPWQSPSFYRRRRFPTPYFRKRLRQMRFDGIGTVDCSLATDFASTERLLDANMFVINGSSFGGAGTFGDPATIFGDSPALTQARLYTQGVARAFSVVLGATSSTEDQVYAYVLMLTDRRDLVVA